MTAPEQPHGHPDRRALVQRYSRHLVLTEIGRSGQEGWLRARMAVRGDGIAAWTARRYLAAAGVQITPSGSEVLLPEDPKASPLAEAIRGADTARQQLLALLPDRSVPPLKIEAPIPDSTPVTTRDFDPLVVVVGAGGLGCPALLGLAWSGIRRIRVLDDDVVELSNLPRQILHDDASIGTPKARSAARALMELKPELEVEAVRERLEAGNTDRLFSGADLIIEASDNFPTKYRVNAAAHELEIPTVIGGALKLEGQCLAVDPRRTATACYRCFFTHAPAPGSLPTCSTVGVFGPVVGLVALQQVALGLAMLQGQAVSGRLWVYEGHSGRWTGLGGKRNSDCVACGHEADDPALRGTAEGRGPSCG
ncbi:MAG: HesA/MoeB/ThiF family protein [Myxococcota bacterium]|nr:HesA/MoeB/ThiF family protein [Myxococcota bacterium]